AQRGDLAHQRALLAGRGLSDRRAVRVACAEVAELLLVELRHRSGEAVQPCTHWARSLRALAVGVPHGQTHLGACSRRTDLHLVNKGTDEGNSQSPLELEPVG